MTLNAINSLNLDLLAETPQLRYQASQGVFGLEKEHVRCTMDGHLALTRHPEALGNKADHPFITTDFSESQVEMITPPMESLDQAYGFLKTLHNIVLKALPENELLWLQSMPPILPEEDMIPVARFEGSSYIKTQYREYLAKMYGRGRQMISGAHFNFSLQEEFFEELQPVYGCGKEELRNRVYMKLLRNLMRYRWILVPALGRSPCAHPSLKLKSFDSDQLIQPFCDFRLSIRSSRIGYRNLHPIQMQYGTLCEYLGALDHNIREGRLLNHNELYMPVRLKLQPGSEEISHLEIRLLDLDPDDPMGLSIDSLRLVHLYCVFALLEPETGSFDRDQQTRADRMQSRVAEQGIVGTQDESADLDLQAEGLRLISRMESILNGLQLDPQAHSQYDKPLQWLRALFLGDITHPSTVLNRTVQENGFIREHLDRGIASRELFSRQDFRFFGLEDMELSTQLLLKESVKRGVHFEILDRRENFIRLSKLGKEEYVVQATRTSLDTYSSILMMENKLVTKKVLQRAGIRVPKGRHFCDADSAYRIWERLQGKPIVVKPKSTNFGIGITILKKNIDADYFIDAVNLAFAEEQEILIEEFIEGREYRFFLIDGQVVGVLHRVPANVVGDGVHTVRELVVEKNKDPLRGTGYRTPLEKIKLGEPEAMFLASQGLNFDTVPLQDEKLFLRENSNISTGGDSIDCTDRVHRSYSLIAARAAEAMKVRITGLDMIIQDIAVPATDTNYAIIEMNFNPAIHIHCFPYQGRNRHLDQALLSCLGFL